MSVQIYEFSDEDSLNYRKFVTLYNEFLNNKEAYPCLGGEFVGTYIIQFRSGKIIKVGRYANGLLSRLISYFSPAHIDIEKIFVIVDDNLGEVYNKWIKSFRATSQTNKDGHALYIPSKQSKKIKVGIKKSNIEIEGLLKEFFINNANRIRKTEYFEPGAQGSSKVIKNYFKSLEFEDDPVKVEIGDNEELTDEEIYELLQNDLDFDLFMSE